jgi:hypothetical protein
MTYGTGTAWQATYTEREAVRRGLISRKDYRQTVLWARTVVEHHQAAGTPRQSWEPNAVHIELLVGPDIENGEAELAGRLKDDVDPMLDRAQRHLAAARARLAAAEQHPLLLTTAESGRTYTCAEAASAVAAHDRTIEAGYAAGKTHHRPSNIWLKRIGGWAPWVEAVGLFAFLTYYLNVPLLQPWEDWLGWTFAVTVVVFAILGQTWLAHHAALSHNQAREATAENHRQHAEAARTRRTRYLLGAAVIAIAITGGMILRGLAALGDVSLGTSIVMALLAAVTGLLMPTMAYLAIALDGSRISRERDSLVAGLDQDFTGQTDYKTGAQGNLDLVTETVHVVTQKLLPDICASVQATVDTTHGRYNFGRIQIGGLVADPPSKTSLSVRQASDGAWQGQISTGIPGARAVDLVPLLDRASRLCALERERAALQTRHDAIPPHPWTSR